MLAALSRNLIFCIVGAITFEPNSNRQFKLLLVTGTAG